MCDILKLNLVYCQDFRKFYVKYWVNGEPYECKVLNLYKANYKQIITNQKNRI